MPQTSASQFVQQGQALLHQSQRAGFNAEVEALFKTHSPQQAGGIVHKGESMQHTDMAFS